MKKVDPGPYVPRGKGEERSTFLGLARVCKDLFKAMVPVVSHVVYVPARNIHNLRHYEVRRVSFLYGTTSPPLYKVGLSKFTGLTHLWLDSRSAWDYVDTDSERRPWSYHFSRNDPTNICYLPPTLTHVMLGPNICLVKGLPPLPNIRVLGISNAQLLAEIMSVDTDYDEFRGMSLEQKRWLNFRTLPKFSPTLEVLILGWQHAGAYFWAYAPALLDCPRLRVLAVADSPGYWSFRIAPGCWGCKNLPREPWFRLPEAKFPFKCRQVNCSLACPNCGDEECFSNKLYIRFSDFKVELIHGSQLSLPSVYRKLMKRFFEIKLPAKFYGLLE